MDSGSGGIECNMSEGSVTVGCSMMVVEMDRQEGVNLDVVMPTNVAGTGAATMSMIGCGMSGSSSGVGIGGSGSEASMMGVAERD